MTGDVLGRFVRPDSIVVVTTEAGSAKFAAYRRPIGLRPNWHLIVVVPSAIRADWMIRQAASLDLGAQAWVVTRTDLTRDSLDTVLRPLTPGSPLGSIRSLLKPPVRLLPAPVGSRAWLELLADGGGEGGGVALAP
jgi:hypothetical protein